MCIVGISMEYANPGDSVKIMYSINCRDPCPPGWREMFVQQELDGLIYPEVIERAQNGILGNE